MTHQYSIITHTYPFMLFSIFPEVLCCIIGLRVVDNPYCSASLPCTAEMHQKSFMASSHVIATLVFGIIP